MKQFYLHVAAFLVVLSSYGQSAQNSKNSTNPLHGSKTSTPSADREPTNNVGYFKLTLNGGTKSYNTEFYFNEASTFGLDPGYDAAMPMSVTPNFCIYSKLIDGGAYANVDFAVQSLPYTCLTSQMIIPVSVNINQGYQCSIKISKTYLKSNVEIYLEDRLTNTFTLLNNAAYNFTSETVLSGEGRFYLHVSTNDVTLANESNTLNTLRIYNTPRKHSITVEGLLTEKTTVNMFDLQGRVVSKVTLDTTNNLNLVDVSNLNQGVYIVVLQNSNQQKTQKVLIR